MACVSRLETFPAWVHTWRQLMSPLREPRLSKPSQLFCQAGHACTNSSSCHPGITCHDTALKFAIDELYVEGATPEPLTRYPAPLVGGVEQEDNKAIIVAAAITTTLTSSHLYFKIMIANLLDEYPMLLFVIEGAIALGLLLFIVLWTGKGKK